MSAWKIGDAVAIASPVSQPDGFDISLAKGETATITEVYDDGWYAIRLHKNGLVIDFHQANLSAPRVLQKYLVPKAFAYPLSVAAVLCMLFASDQTFGPTKAQSSACAGETIATGFDAIRQKTLEGQPYTIIVHKQYIPAR